VELPAKMTLEPRAMHQSQQTLRQRERKSFATVKKKKKYLSLLSLHNEPVEKANEILNL
jgi:hypothetical protein